MKAVKAGDMMRDESEAGQESSEPEPIGTCRFVSILSNLIEFKLTLSRNLQPDKQSMKSRVPPRVSFDACSQAKQNRQNKACFASSATPVSLAMGARFVVVLW